MNNKNNKLRTKPRQIKTKSNVRESRISTINWYFKSFTYHDTSWKMLLPLASPQYAGEFETVKSTIHINPSRKRSFWKRSSNQRKLKTPTFLFSAVDEKHFEKGAVRNRWRHDNNLISPADRVSLKHKTKIAGVYERF